MLIASVANVAFPYKNYEDAENRRAAVELARLSAPGDLWIGYDGLEELPVSNGLLLEHWLQQLAEVKYNLLARAPGPVRWMPREKEAIAPSSGRTWLIVHRSGCPDFDEGRLERLKASLKQQRGSPEVHDWPLLLGESIRAYAYPATGSE